MKSIKKFSAMSAKDQSITESAKVTKEAVDELIKKIGFNSIEELKKEKDLLSKLEAMSKTFNNNNDISEDDIEEDRAEDIEDEVKVKGAPKSLEGTKDKEGDEEVVASAEEEVEEDRAEDIEDEVTAIGTTKSLADKEGEEVTTDQVITKEVPAEADEVEDEDGVDVEDNDSENEEVETPKAKKRIMAFEDFIKEKEETINKNIKYHDDDEEPEDYAMPVADSEDPFSESDESTGKDDEKEGDELEDKGDKKVDSEDEKEKADHYKGAVKSDDAQIKALKKDKEYDKEEEEDAEKNESTIMSFANFVNEAYDKVVWGGDKDDKSKTHDGEDYEEEDEADEAYDVVTLGGNKGDKSKTKKGDEDYEDEDDKDESVTETEETAAKALTIADDAKAMATGAAGVVIPEVKGDGSQTAAGIAASDMERGKPKDISKLSGKLVTPDQKVTAVVPDEANSVSEDGIEIPLVKEAVNEGEITSDDEFKDYATNLLKDAFGDDFDEKKATSVIDGLISKHKEDYGAMVGALQSSMG